MSFLRVKAALKCHEKQTVLEVGSRLDVLLSSRTKFVCREHVYKDLRPYVCTFTDCTSAAKQYHAKQDLIHHETQVHKRQWSCPEGCQEIFATQKSLAQHLRVEHSENLIETRMSLLLFLSEHPMSETTMEPCPLCPTNLPLTELYTHVAQHLEQLSLFVLPSYAEDSGDSLDGSDASHQARNDRSSRSTNLTMDLEWADTFVPSTADHEQNSYNQDTQTLVQNPPGDLFTTRPDVWQWFGIYRTDTSSEYSADTDLVLLHSRTNQSRDAQRTVKTADERAAEFDDVYALQNFIDNFMEMSYRGVKQEFLPRLAMERASTLAVIERTIVLDKDLYLPKTTFVHFVRKVYKTCRKLFVTCVYGNLSMQTLRGLMAHGLTDAGFPFQEEELPKEIRSMSKCGELRRFVRGQRLFDTVNFELGSMQVFRDSQTVPIDWEESESSLLGQGTFCSVYAIRMHPDQHSLPNVSHLSRL